MSRLLFILVSVMCVIMNAESIKATKLLKTSGLVSDMVVRNDALYVANDNGKIDIFSIKTFKKSTTLTLPAIIGANGKPAAPKVYSLDHHGGDTIAVTESGGDFRNLFLYRKGVWKKLLDSSRGLLIKKVRFFTPDKIVLGLTGDTIVLYDSVKNSLIYQIQAGGGIFRDMVLSPSHQYVSIGDEGGEIPMVDLAKGKIVKTLRGINLDNIYRLDHKNGTIITGGHDRRVGLYRPRNSYYIQTEFFVYSVALTPSAAIGVYSDGDENELQVFDVNTKANLTRLKAGNVSIDHLIFIDEHSLFAAGEDTQIYYWRLP